MITVLLLTQISKFEKLSELDHPSPQVAWMKDFVTNHPQIVKVAPTVPPPSPLAVALLRDVCWWHCCGWRWQVTIKMPTLSGWCSDNNLALKTSETTDYRRNFWDPPSQTTASYHAIIESVLMYWITVWYVAQWQTGNLCTRLSTPPREPLAADRPP